MSIARKIHMMPGLDAMAFYIMKDEHMPCISKSVCIQNMLACFFADSRKIK